ncbi:P pilus assembly protein, pilin FimA [Klebsiella pneumoniae]|nr:P pilus assembly protein, pilin FimA [Klebsiella pneumoniae]
MKKMTAAAALILGVIASGQAMAAGSTVMMQVQGKLLPSACNVDVGGAIVDLGEIDIAKLKEYESTTLTDSAKKVNITVDCPLATRTGLKFAESTGAQDFVLGTVGTYDMELNIAGSQVDGKAVNAMFVSDDPNGFHSFGNATNMKIINANINKDFGIDISAGTDRDKAKLKRYSVTVTPVIKPTSEFDSSKETSFTGATTVEVMYR